MSNQFNLRLLFAMQGSGEYLASVRVNVLDAYEGIVLTAESQGPWFFNSIAARRLCPGRQYARPRSTTAPETGSAHR